MANTTITPNMLIPVPVPGVDPGPDWANNIVNDMNIIDSHNHTAGQGVQIPPAGLNINSDLPFNGNNATALRSARFTAQGAPLSAASDLGCVYVSGADLYYNDEAGNQVRITLGGSVNAGAGSITGLPSGTASASYSGLANAFTWQSATNTPATMNVGNLVVGATGTANAHTVTLQASAAQSSNIIFTLPTSVPGSTSFLSSDASGNMAAGASGATITNPTINGGLITDVTINAGSVIDATTIGATVPSTGAFTSISSGSSSVALKWRQFTGSLAGSGATNVTVSGTIGGVVGTWDNGSNTSGMIGTATTSFIHFTNFGPSGTYASNVEIQNSAAGSLNYTVTVFYV